MRKLYLATLLSVVGISSLGAQGISNKYGEITEHELKMTSYAADTSAVAVVIYDTGKTYYDFLNNEFSVITTYSKKVKILKTEGLDYGTISIPYYRQAGVRESITKLEGYAYNLENGKIVKSKLEKKYIFEEEVTPNLYLMKFSIPGVKAGTVIEYKYVRTSPFYYEVPDWKIQGELPVMSSSYEVTIPEYFIYTTSMTGYEKIERRETTGNKSIDIMLRDGQHETISCTTKILSFTASNVPSLKDEAYVWCTDDYRAGVRLELNATRFPGDFYRPYARTWKDIQKTLLSMEFVANIKASNPYRDELKPILAALTDEEAKIRAIYAFVMSKIRWNDTYSMYNNPRDAVKNGTGSNSQINTVLVRALREADINATLVLMSRRDLGRLPVTYASLDKLNTFIVLAVTSDGKAFYMDGSSVYGGPNMLPTDLMVDRALILDAENPEQWVNLTNIAPNKSTRSFRSTLGDDGTMTTEMTGTYTNQLAYSCKSAHGEAKDSTDFAEKYQTWKNIVIGNMSFTGLEPLSEVATETTSFTKKYDAEGEYLYVNPLILPHIEKNPFTQSERKLPVEFDFPYSYQIRSTIVIPAGYAVEEVPQSVNMTLNNNAGQLQYVIQHSGNIIELAYTFELNQTIFPHIDYEALRDFFGLVADKNSELVVLKKL